VNKVVYNDFTDSDSSVLLRLISS